MSGDQWHVEGGTWVEVMEGSTAHDQRHVLMTPPPKASSPRTADAQFLPQFSSQEHVSSQPSRSHVQTGEQSLAVEGRHRRGRKAGLSEHGRDRGWQAPGPLRWIPGGGGEGSTSQHLPSSRSSPGFPLLIKKLHGAEESLGPAPGSDPWCSHSPSHHP